MCRCALRDCTAQPHRAPPQWAPPRVRGLGPGVRLRGRVCRVSPWQTNASRRTTLTQVRCAVVKQRATVPVARQGYLARTARVCAGRVSDVNDYHRAGRERVTRCRYQRDPERVQARSHSNATGRGECGAWITRQPAALSWIRQAAYPCGTCNTPHQRVWGACGAKVKLLVLLPPAQEAWTAAVHGARQRRWPQRHRTKRRWCWVWRDVARVVAAGCARRC